MRITITPEGNIEFDVDLTNGHIAEAAALMRAVQQEFAPATTPQPAAPAGAATTVARKANAEARRKALALAEHKANSRYYQLKASQGARTSRIVAETYHYIASYKNGRTTDQICEHFHAGKATVWSRTASLLKDNLIVQPGGKGSPWVVTNTVLETVHRDPYENLERDVERETQEVIATQPVVSRKGRPRK